MSRFLHRIGWIGLWLWLAGQGTPVQAIPAWLRGGTSPVYEETEPDPGFHLFNRPEKKDAASQWAYVLDLQRAGKTRAAAKQALALRLFWPYAPEAPQAQLLYARLLEERGHLEESFDAFQYMVDHYTGRFEFNELIATQRRLAQQVMVARHGRFLLLPGFSAPERAIPLFEKIVENAPEDPETAGDYVFIGRAHEDNFDYAEAIEAYFKAMNRFPDSPHALEAAYRQALCHVRLSDDEPNDQRALATARAACVLFLQRHPTSEHREEMQERIARLSARQAQNDFDLAVYYDRQLKRPTAALIAYRTFLERHPGDAHADEARTRIQQLDAAQKDSRL